MSKKSITSPAIILLAAGMGKRMQSSLPKVLQEIAGKPLLFHILDRIREVSPRSPIALVVGHGRDMVEAYIKAETRFHDLNIEIVVQAEQKGTGHAARCAMQSSWGEKRLEEGAQVLVLPGDIPLITNALLEGILFPLQEDELVRLMTCEFPDPTGLGRVIREKSTGRVQRIVEDRDATPEQRKIREVAVSIYIFQSRFLMDSLQKLTNQNAQMEYYLTDVLELAASGKIADLRWNSSEDLMGINDLWELAIVHRVMNQRCVKNWAQKGVRCIDLDSTHIDVTVQLENQVTLHPGVILKGMTRIGKGSTIGSGVTLTDSDIQSHVYVKTGSVIERSKVGESSQVGPYAHLRPGSNVAAHVKIGNFVELKNTQVGERSSIAHLSYLGDAEVGQNVNIGCGFITCNFDGRTINGKRKHTTVIEDDVFLGSDCQTVAPVRIGKGAYIASGSTVTQDVEPGSLAIARSRQVNKPGYAERLKSMPGGKE